MNVRTLAASSAAALIAFLAAAPFAGAQTGENKERPAQAAVASKNAAFVSVPAGDASVKKALPATDLAGAKKQVGKAAAFVGTVDRTFTPKGNGLVILNFAKDYKTAVTGVVRAKDFAKFPDLKALQGKKVLVSGTVQDYKGRPEIALSAPSQVKIVK